METAGIYIRKQFMRKKKHEKYHKHMFPQNQRELKAVKNVQCT